MMLKMPLGLLVLLFAGTAHADDAMFENLMLNLTKSLAKISSDLKSGVRATSVGASKSDGDKIQASHIAC